MSKTNDLWLRGDAIGRVQESLHGTEEELSFYPGGAARLRLVSGRGVGRGKKGGSADRHERWQSYKCC